MPARAPFRVARIATLLVTTAALLALPFPAAAAKGDGVVPTVSARMDVVSTEGLMAFDVSLLNDGNSTLTQMRFDGTLAGATYVGATIGCTPADGGGETVRCLLGNIAAGDHPSFMIFFEAPAEAGEVTLDGVFTSDARQGNPNSTSSDTWEDDVTVTVSADGESYASWQRAHDAELDPILVGSPQFQATEVVVPPFTEDDYPARVRQLSEAPTFDCEGTRTGFGRSVELELAMGNPFDDDQPLEVEITYSAAAAPKKSPGNVSIGHVSDAGLCKPVPRGCSSNPAPCYDAVWSGSGKSKAIVVTALLPTNGKVRGY